MRLLPNLEYLNGLPVDRDALDEEEEDGQMAAVKQEALASGHPQVQERPGEEDSQGYDDTQPEILNHLPRGNRANDTSLTSA